MATVASTYENRLQKIFDRVSQHLVTQRAKAVGDKTCQYWDKATGRKCAVGCLIDESVYSTGIEGHSLHNSKILSAVQLSGYPNLTDLEERVLAKLQHIHDEQMVADWPNALKDLARDCDLDATNIPDTLEPIPV